jgi:hypothetical protein
MCLLSFQYLADFKKNKEFYSKGTETFNAAGQPVIYLKV